MQEHAKPCASVGASRFEADAAQGALLAIRDALADVAADVRRLDVFDVLDPATRHAAERFVDGLAESFESLKTTLQVSARYDRIYNLTDTACTRENLLQRLKKETEAGNVVDLYIYGHGSCGPPQLQASGGSVFVDRVGERMHPLGGPWRNGLSLGRRSRSRRPRSRTPDRRSIGQHAAP